MGVDKQLSRWAEHFKELLTRQTSPRQIPVYWLGKPARAEIRKAIKQLKNGKAAGAYEIPAEALKVDPEMLAIAEML